MKIRVGFGYDVHPLKEGKDFWLGGIKIPHTKGAEGHSDADVLTHAICDAMLGALALGDLGQHFPDSNPRYRGISSQTLLGECLGLVNAQGGRVVNVDATVIAEAPKLFAWFGEMQKRLAETLRLPPGQVSVKAKSPEGLGLLGRKEGIAAMAVVGVEVEDLR